MSAQYLPGKDSAVAANIESRVMKDCSDWKSNYKCSRGFAQGSHPSVWMYLPHASPTNYPRCFSWGPDHKAEATDAFLHYWKGIVGYANPPWNLVRRVLLVVDAQEAKVVLVAPI